VADHNVLAGSLAVAEIVASDVFADFMAEHYPGRPPLLAIVAQEVNTREGEIMGMFIKLPLKRGLSMDETIAAIHEQGGLVNVPHPFSRIAHRRPREQELERYVDRLDLIEVYNARSVWRADDRTAMDFARRYKLGRTAGSDAHFRSEIGRGYVWMERFDNTPASFLSASRHAVPGGRKTPPAAPFATWLRNARGAFNDIRLQLRLTGRP